MIKSVNLKFSIDSQSVGDVLLCYVKACFAVTHEKLMRHELVSELEIDLAMPISFIYGLSGAGKTSLLREIRVAIPEAQWLPEPINRLTPIIDSFKVPREISASLLYQVGLGEVYLFIKTYEQLSDGQKYRYRLALALSRNPRTLLIDSFLESVDRLTARNIAYSFFNVCRKRGIQVFVASVSDDIRKFIGADQEVEFSLAGMQVRRSLERIALKPLISYRDGTFDEVKHLLVFHYFNDFEISEDYCYRIIVAEEESVPIAFSAIVSPYPIAWNQEQLFAKINQRIWVSAITIVHPSYRGLGICKTLLGMDILGRGMVTRGAMYRFHKLPLFAGYQEYPSPYSKRRPLHSKIEAYVRILGVNDIVNLHSQTIRRRFITALSSDASLELRHMLHDLYKEISMDEYMMYHFIAFGVAPPQKNIRLCKEYFNYLFEDYSTDFLLSEAVLLEMPTFYRSPQ